MSQEIIDIKAEVIDSYVDPNDLARIWLLVLIQKITNFGKRLLQKLRFDGNKETSKIAVVVPMVL